MASGTQGATAPRYDDTPFDKFLDPDHPEAKKTHNLVMEYIEKRTRVEWVKRDVAPIVGCTVAGAVVGGTVGGCIAGPPGAATGILIGAGAGAGFGLIVGVAASGIINLVAFRDWAKKTEHGTIAETVDLMTGCVPSQFICTIKQTIMMNPMKHKTLGSRYDKDVIEKLFSLPDENRLPGDTRPANTRLDPNTRQVISLDDFEVDDFALLSMKSIVSKELQTNPKLINARPKVKEGLQKFSERTDKDKENYYYNEVNKLDKLLYDNKIKRPEHFQKLCELNKELSMLG